MKQNVNPVSRGCWLALLALCLVSLAAHLGTYSQLPDVVPTHWDVGGEVDGWAPRPSRCSSTCCRLRFSPF